MLASHDRISLDLGPDGLPNLDWFQPQAPIDAIVSQPPKPQRAKAEVDRRAWRRRRVMRGKT